MTLPSQLRVDLKNVEARTGVKPMVFPSESIETSERLGELLLRWDQEDDGDYDTTISFGLITRHRAPVGPGEFPTTGLCVWEALDGAFQMFPLELLRGLAGVDPNDLKEVLAPVGDEFRPAGYAAMMHTWSLPTGGREREQLRQELKASGRAVADHPDRVRARVMVACAFGATVAIARTRDDEDFSRYPVEELGQFVPLMEAAVQTLLRSDWARKE